jgi:hypothetical protein
MALRKRTLRPFAALSAVVALGLASCSENRATAPGLDSEILVEQVGPVGVADPLVFGSWAWAVNTIDSLVFTDDIDSSRLEVTSYRMTDPQGRTVAGTVRFMPSNAFIFHTQPFPSMAYDFHIDGLALSPGVGKMYFVPAQPLSGHTEYTCRLSTGIRMTRGTLKRDVFEFRFTTGDSVAPPTPAR